MFCVAQLREWQRHEDDLNAAGARLLVLTAEGQSITQAALTSKKIDVPVAVVDPSLWVALGRVNAKRPELPQPTTFVIDPQGTVIWSRASQAYSERSSAAHVVRVVRDHIAGAPTPRVDAPIEAVAQPVIDEPQIAVIAQAIGPKRRMLHVSVSEGWHVYGRRERSAEPLFVQSQGATLRAKIPGGERVVWDPDEPASRWITGSFDVRVRGSFTHGELHYQACKRSICLPPTSASFTVEPTTR